MHRTSLLPLWEKVARTLSAPDEGSASAERNPSPVLHAWHLSHPLPQGERVKTSIRRQWNLIVDQRIQRGLDVHLGLDDAGLLQRYTGRQNRLALRRADPAVRQLGALLELLVDNVIRQFCRRDKRLLQIVVMAKRIFACLFVSREHAADDVRIVPQKLLADIEDTPGVGVGLPEEQLGALLDFGLRHHRIETRPGVDIAADQRGLAVGMLQQHRGDVLLAQARGEQRAQQEYVGISAARDRDALTPRSEE